MRDWIRVHAHSLAAFVAVMVVAAGISATVDPDLAPKRQTAVLPTPGLSFPLPDADNDTYEDAEDLVHGDAHLRIEVTALEAPGTRPYLMIGTQDDHWRHGAGRALEWLHVVDPDPLGHAPGSPEWEAQSLRTGTWLTSTPMDGARKEIAPTGIVDARPGVTWPQVFHLNVRDDAPATITIELWDARPEPDVLVADWDIKIHVDVATPFSVDFKENGAKLQARIEAHAGLDHDDRRSIADRWHPTYRFSESERFYPAPGERLQQFHGFASRSGEAADHRTWTREFNNARATYTLLLADFDGDGRTDHHDVAVMSDVLRTGGGDRVYAHVFQSHQDTIVVQYWTIYLYNFVEDADGNSIEALAHRGDREFIQLVFEDLDAALRGSPQSIAYSQHYKGIRILDPDMSLAPFHNTTHPDVFVAAGSHASYPVAGDDSRLRGPLVGFGDVFDGLGEAWTAEPERLELFGRQEWAFGHLWGPFTRHHRDLGTATRPLLQHDFRYAWHDPLDWERSLSTVEQDALEGLYG